jgi:hypothetical protein
LKQELHHQEEETNGNRRRSSIGAKGVEYLSKSLSINNTLTSNSICNRIGGAFINSLSINTC